MLRGWILDRVCVRREREEWGVETENRYSFEPMLVENARIALCCGTSADVLV